jgi:hypothetical protein
MGVVLFLALMEKPADNQAWWPANPNLGNPADNQANPNLGKPADNQAWWPANPNLK